MSIKTQRNSLRLSQSKLARISGVSRFKICMFELGSGTLTTEENERIKAALAYEIARLRQLTAEFDLNHSAEND